MYSRTRKASSNAGRQQPQPRDGRGTTPTAQATARHPRPDRRSAPHPGGPPIPDATIDTEILEEDLLPEPECIDFQVGDSVVYPHHGAGRVVKKEAKKVLGEERQYLTIKILHNDMTVMVPCENAGKAGLRRVIGDEDVRPPPPPPPPPTPPPPP